MEGATGAPRRMRPARVVLPVVALVLVALAIGSRACSPDPTLGQEQAVAVATAEAGFPVVEHQVRFVRQGINQRPAWVVGVRAADGQAKTFVIDARDGAVLRVEQSAD